MRINYMEIKKQWPSGEYFCHIEKLDGDRIDLPPPYWIKGPLISLQYKRGNAKTDEKMKRMLIAMVIDDHKKTITGLVDEIEKLGRCELLEGHP